MADEGALGFFSDRLTLLVGVPDQPQCRSRCLSLVAEVGWSRGAYPLGRDPKDSALKHARDILLDGGGDDDLLSHAHPSSEALPSGRVKLSEYVVEEKDWVDTFLPQEHVGRKSQGQRNGP